jgi:hypothetical protein
MSLGANVNLSNFPASHSYLPVETLDRTRFPLY